MLFTSEILMWISTLTFTIKIMSLISLFQNLIIKKGRQKNLEHFSCFVFKYPLIVFICACNHQWLSGWGKLHYGLYFTYALTPFLISHVFELKKSHQTASSPKPHCKLNGQLCTFFQGVTTPACQGNWVLCLQQSCNCRIYCNYCIYNTINNVHYKHKNPFQSTFKVEIRLIFRPYAFYSL